MFGKYFGQFEIKSWYFEQTKPFFVHPGLQQKENKDWIIYAHFSSWLFLTTADVDFACLTPTLAAEKQFMHLYFIQSGPQTNVENC